MQRNGRKNFIRAIEQISKGNQGAADVVAELGTMKTEGFFLTLIQKVQNLMTIF